jgi:hypothetical protein
LKRLGIAGPFLFLVVNLCDEHHPYGMPKNYRLFLALSLSLPLAISLTACDRGASDEIGAARRFSDAVVRNDVVARDSMIATQKFKEYFDNEYVGHDMLVWFNTFYSFSKHDFSGKTVADVDRDLQTELKGSLIDTTEIEETGMVKAWPPGPPGSGDPAYFWMVHPHGKPWRVAVVTKGDTKVNFK